jgi:dUTP pyrophosphatase
LYGGGVAIDWSTVKVMIKMADDAADIPLPRYMTAGSSGLDIHAAVTRVETIKPGERLLIPTGVFAAVPVGYELQIRPRSGLAINNGIIILNTPGTIDSDYRGEIKVILANLSDKAFTVNRGDRIAQMVVAPVARAIITVKNELPATKRNNGGFGHTG